MGEGNVATIEALFQEFARREDELALRTYDEHVVWDTRSLAAAPDLQGVFHGLEGVRTWWRRWLEAWDEVAMVDGPHHRSSGSQVVSWWRQRVRGKSSGASLDMDVAIVWTFENGRIVRAAVFPSGDEARRAAELSA